MLCYIYVLYFSIAVSQAKSVRELQIQENEGALCEEVLNEDEGAPYEDVLTEDEYRINTSTEVL